MLAAEAEHPFPAVSLWCVFNTTSLPFPHPNIQILIQ